MIETKTIKQQEVLQEVPRLSSIGEIFSIKTKDGPITFMEIGEWQEQKMPNGEKVQTRKALAFPCLREWLPTILGIEEPSEAYTTVRLRLAKYLAPIFAALAGATAVGGCVNGINDHGNSNGDTSSINPALTMDELSGRTTQYETAFTQPGDTTPNISNYNGDAVITFVREGYCYYVRAADILVALEQQNAQKISLPPNDWGSEGGCMVHNNKIIYGGGDLIADLVEMLDGGLQGENYQILQPNNQVSDKTIAPADNPDGGIGDPLLLGDVPTGLGHRLMTHNLITNESILRTDINTKCGTPHRAPEGGAWVQGFYELFGNDPVVCTIVRAETMDGLRNGWPFLKIYSADGGYTDQRNPRIGPQGVLVFQGRSEKKPSTNPRSLDNPKIYYAIFPYCGDNQCNGNETADSCPNDCLAPSNDGGPNEDGGPDGSDSDGGGAESDGSVDDGGKPDGSIPPDDGGEPDGSVPPDDGGQVPDGGTDPDGGGTNPDAGIPNNDGGAPREDGGNPRPDGGQVPDGGGNRTDGGENRTDGGGTGPDGGGTNPDGGGTESDGGTSGPDGSVNPDDGGTDPDGGENCDAGLQPDGSMPNGDKDYIGQPPGCSCKTSNNNPSSNMASTILLGIGIVGMKLRNALRKKGNK